MPARPYLWRHSSADVLVPYLWADVSGVERSGWVLVQRWLPARGRKYANQSQVQVQPVRQSGSWSDGGAEYHWLQRSIRQFGRETCWKRGCCGNSGWSHHSLHSTNCALPKTRQKGQDKGNTVDWHHHKTDLTFIRWIWVNLTQANVKIQFLENRFVIFSGTLWLCLHMYLLYFGKI